MIWYTRRPSRCGRGEERSLDCAPFAAQGKRDDSEGRRTRRNAKSRPDATRYEPAERSLGFARDDSEKGNGNSEGRRTRRNAKSRQVRFRGSGGVYRTPETGDATAMNPQRGPSASLPSPLSGQAG